MPAGTSLQGGRYQIMGQLGQGGMGAVYLAKDKELFGRLCVVKQMRPFFATQSERRKAEEDFKREAEVLARLNHPGHPRIPEVYGYFVEGLDQYLVMKYIEGESLERRLERLKRPLSEAEVVRLRHRGGRRADLSPQPQARAGHPPRHQAGQHHHRS